MQRKYKTERERRRLASAVPFEEKRERMREGTHTWTETRGKITPQSCGIKRSAPLIAVMLPRHYALPLTVNVNYRIRKRISRAEGNGRADKCNARMKTGRGGVRGYPAHMGCALGARGGERPR